MGAGTIAFFKVFLIVSEMLSAVLHSSPVDAIFLLTENIDSVFLLPKNKWRSFRTTTHFLRLIEHLFRSQA